jgi:hypothetical protein
MPYLLVRHKAQGYGSWKSIFDEHGSTRQAYGSRGGYLFRNGRWPTQLL